MSDYAAVSEMFSRRDLVKIDGLREPEHAAAAVAAGADLIGFVFARARRQVTPSVARACIESGRVAAPGRRFLAIGVFVDSPAEEIAAVCETAGLDAVQLHGSEPPDVLQRLGVSAIKAFRPQPQLGQAELMDEINRYHLAAVPPIAMLIDGYSASVAGGAGVRADWDLAAAIAAKQPILLGGGLNPDNVSAAIHRVRPIGVDVSSGVEENGTKSAHLIESFIQKARAAFDELKPDRLATPVP